jgi:RNA recognition motif-containing protein
MNIYVGNLSYNVTEADLQEVFQAFGHVTSAKIITDKFSGKSRGFGFVEMASEDEARQAIDGLNGKELKERSIIVNEARQRQERRRTGGRPGTGRHGGGDRQGGRKRSW